MSEGKRGPGRPKKTQPGQDAPQDQQDVGVAASDAADRAEARADQGGLDHAPDEIAVRVVKRYERGGVVVPVGTVFAVRDTKEIRRQIKHRCLEQVE